MKALLSGGTGFVGTVFLKRLLQDGWHVTLITRDKKKLADWNYEHLSVYQADLGDHRQIDHIAELLAERNGRFDAVFHLAAAVRYFGNRKELHRANVEGTRNILNLAIKTHGRKFIYASSIEAIGPVRTEDVPASPNMICQPISAYGETKVQAEQLVMSVARDHFPAMILRIGNVYGPGHVSFVSEIAEAILKRNKLLRFLPVYEDRWIHPIHNDDVADGLLAAHQSRAPSSVVVLAGEYATVGELFGICAEVLGRNLPIRVRRTIDTIYLTFRRECHKLLGTMDLATYLMAPSGERVHRAYSIEETGKVMNYFPKVALRRGIEQTLQWAMESGFYQRKVGIFERLKSIL